MEKYDISKSFKLGNSHIEKLNRLTSEYNFNSDSEAVRYAIDFVTALQEYGLMQYTVGKILEKKGEKDK